jgi:hypothetical protein
LRSAVSLHFDWPTTPLGHVELCQILYQCAFCLTAIKKPYVRQSRTCEDSILNLGALKENAQSARHTSNVLEWQPLLWRNDHPLQRPCSV